MRLVSFRSPGHDSWGIALDRGIADIGARYRDRWPDLVSVVRDGSLAALDDAQDLTVDFEFSDVRFDIPLPNPERIFCIGVNYQNRNEEYADGQPPPRYPSIFVRFPASLVGHGEALLRPPESEQLDYEGEIAIVIGKPGRRIAEAAALDHIAAVTLCNEGTVRDWLRHGKFNVTQGKNFDSSGSMGPWLVPFREEAQIADIELRTRVNGELRQRERTSRMVFPFPKLISYVSTFTALMPGDIISTGTPTGAGATHDPPVWLKPGDTIEVEADGIGTLRNTVEDESASCR